MRGHAWLTLLTGGWFARHQLGPVKWEAPEVLGSRQGVKVFSAASDVYAFGVMLFELVTNGQAPWATLSLLQAANAVSSGKTLEGQLPSTTPAPLRMLMAQCWRFKAADRPGMRFVLAELMSIRKQLRIPS